MPNKASVKEKSYALVSPVVLKWARESTGLDPRAAAHAAGIADPEKLLQAENGDAKLTFRQVEKLAHACRLPLWVLFLKSPLEEPALPLDFRSPNPSAVKQNPELIKTIRSARDRREAALELFSDLDIKPSTLPSLKSDDEIVEYMRPMLCTDSWNTDTSKLAGAKALSATKERVESSLSALVFEALIDPSDLRGCSLYDELLSIVVLSSKDSPNAKRFTLAHELAHLMLRQSGVCTPMTPKRSGEDERRCDAIAGQALLPDSDLERALGPEKGRDIESLIAQLVKQYALSYSAVAVRLRQAEVITAKDLYSRLEFYRGQYKASREATADGSGGPNYHLLQVQRLGPTFTSVVLDGLENDVISVTRGADLLGVTPSHKSFNSVREQMVRAYGS